MKITKYPQSAAIVECNGTKILIDPGKIKFDESFLKDWKSVDAVLQKLQDTVLLVMDSTLQLQTRTEFADLNV